MADKSDPTPDLLNADKGEQASQSPLQVLTRLPRRTLVLLVRIYQKMISPLYGDVCRYEPSCSHYFIGAVEKYGAIVGSIKGIWRICRCNPFSKGGIDPP